MRVFFRLGDAQLREAEAGQVFAERVLHRLRRIGDGRIGDQVLFVFGERDERGQLERTRPREAGEVAIDEGVSQLARAVGAEIHEHDGIAGLHLPVARDDGGLDGFVVLAARIGRIERGDRAVEERRVAFGDGLEGKLHAIPALVAVHRVVAAAERGDEGAGHIRAFGLESFERGARAARRRVAAIEEGVHGDARHAAARGEVEHGEDVRLVAVHAAGRDEAKQVERAIGRLGRVAGLHERGVVEETAVGDRGVDAGEVLVDDAARTDVHVADFGIAHLPVRQTDELPVRLHQRVRIFAQHAPPVRQVGPGDRVVRGVVAMAPAIEDEQEDGFGSGHGRVRLSENAIVADGRARRPKLNGNDARSP